jgi:hypothetical protein
LLVFLAMGCAVRAEPHVASKMHAPDFGAEPARRSVPIVPAATPERDSLRAAIAASLAPSEENAKSDSDAPNGEIKLLDPLVRPESSDAYAEAGPSAARLPPESIRRIVRQSAGKFRDCYQRALLRNVSSSGRVVVRFVIDADGRVSRAEEESASLADRDARQCVLEAFFDLNFPNSTKQRIVVQYPLSFTRDGNAPLDELPNARQAAEPPPPGFAEAMRSGRRALPPPPAVTPHTPRLRHSAPSRCTPGDPLCSDL